MSEDPPYILDFENGGDESPISDSSERVASQNEIRPWVGIKFDCCGAYTRVYRNRQQDAYEGRCPRCGRPVRLQIGPGGTTSRMFRAE
jgi:hypothetical protein